MEMIVVICVIGILAAVSYPLLKGSKPEYDARGASRQLEALLLKARTMAVNQQKPIRVVINCTRPAGTDHCYADLQAAIYNNEEVSGWEHRPQEREVLKPEIQIVKNNVTAGHDGNLTTPNLFWAIFMPANNIYSDPKAFEVFMYHNYQARPEKDGWLIAVNSVSGKIQLTRNSLATP
jgi:Tfp pilus assembly protein FimT